MDNLRKLILEKSYEAGACHIGSALSCVDIVKEIYDILGEDVFIFGKASGAAALYCVLAERGIIDKDRLAYYLKYYPLPSKEVPGVVHSVGSLGHSLPVAAGMALGNRARKVYVLISDGECQEGTTYETALFARQHKLDNLFVIVDANGFQALGRTADILDLETAFEFLGKCFANFDVRRTIKGQGVARFENDNSWHYKNLSKEDLELCLKEEEIQKI